MWYKFENGKSMGTPRIKEYQVAWYDMEHGGYCFDENFYKPEDIGTAIAYVETIEDEGHRCRTRVFACFDDGEQYELKLERIEKGRICDQFDN